MTEHMSSEANTRLQPSMFLGGASHFSFGKDLQQAVLSLYSADGVSPHSTGIQVRYDQCFCAQQLSFLSLTPTSTLKFPLPANDDDDDYDDDDVSAFKTVDSLVF